MIRKATEADIDSMELIAQVMHEESDNYRHCSYDSNKVKSFIRYLIKDDTGIALVAEKDQKIIGGFLGTIAPQFFGHDKIACDFALFLIPEERGGMTAIRLVKQYIEEAKKHNVINITIANSTGTDSETVQQLYQRLGFTKMGGVYSMRG